MRIKTLRSLLLAALLLGPVACGIKIADSAPLTFVAPLEGTWVMKHDPDVELRITMPGGQDLFATDFPFTAEIENVGTRSTVAYNGTASGQDFELREPGTGALVLTGMMVLDSASSLQLSDGSLFDKDFDPDFGTGTWQDVNRPGNYYKFQIQTPNAGNTGSATGCAAGTSATEETVQGPAVADYDGETITLFRVNAGGQLSISSAGYFFGASAMRVQRVNGFLHLQRVNRNDTCP